METYMPAKGEVEARWYLIDATDKVLGRLAVKVTNILRGKNKPTFTSHMDTGDHIVIINADKICVTGNKAKQKNYYRHSGYKGGLTTVTLEKMREKHPERIIELAVKGMLPKNRLGRAMFRKLKVYAGPEHNQQAQQPEIIDI